MKLRARTSVAPKVPDACDAECQTDLAIAFVDLSEGGDDTTASSSSSSSFFVPRPTIRGFREAGPVRRSTDGRFEANYLTWSKSEAHKFYSKPVSAKSRVARHAELDAYMAKQIRENSALLAKVDVVSARTVCSGSAMEKWHEQWADSCWTGPGWILDHALGVAMSIEQPERRESRSENLADLNALMFLVHKYAFRTADRCGSDVFHPFLQAIDRPSVIDNDASYDTDFGAGFPVDAASSIDRLIDMCSGLNQIGERNVRRLGGCSSSVFSVESKIDSSIFSHGLAYVFDSEEGTLEVYENRTRGKEPRIVESDFDALIMNSDMLFADRKTFTDGGDRIPFRAERDAKGVATPLWHSKVVDLQYPDPAFVKDRKRRSKHGKVGGGTKWTNQTPTKAGALGGPFFADFGVMLNVASIVVGAHYQMARLRESMLTLVKRLSMLTPIFMDDFLPHAAEKPRSSSLSQRSMLSAGMAELFEKKVGPFFDKIVDECTSPIDPIPHIGHTHPSLLTAIFLMRAAIPRATIVYTITRAVCRHLHSNPKFKERVEQLYQPGETPLAADRLEFAIFNAIELELVRIASANQAGHVHYKPMYWSLTDSIDLILGAVQYPSLEDRRGIVSPYLLAAALVATQLAFQTGILPLADYANPDPFKRMFDVSASHFAHKLKDC